MHLAKRAIIRGFWSMAVMALAGCSGEIGDPDPPFVEPTPDIQPGGTTVEPVPEDPLITTCEGGYVHVLRRLTPHQYETVVARMFPGVNLSDFDMPGIVPDKFDYENDATLSAPTPGVVARYEATSRAIAAQAVAELATWNECELVSGDCLQQTVLRLAELGFRRPLDAETQGAFERFLAGAAFTPAETLEMAIVAILDSPDFIYVSEVGDDALDAPEGLRALQPHEIAHRLALFLWDEPADTALIEALSTADAQTEAGYAAIVESMFDDERISAGVDRFTSQWMPLREGDWGQSIGTYRLRDDNETFPDADFPSNGGNGARESLRTSSIRFLRSMFLESSLHDLFTSREVLINDYLAVLYGMDRPGSEIALVEATAPEGERAGILTHPAVLASPPGNATFPSILRAVHLMTQITCTDPGQPNFADIDTSVAQQDRVLSSREQLEVAHLDGTEANPQGCGGSCHVAIDGVGFPLAVFDRLGRFGATEVVTQRIRTDRPEDCAAGVCNCRGSGERRDCEVTETFTIDTSGHVLDEDVRDVLDMADRLGSSAAVKTCFTEHLYRYALGRSSLNAIDHGVIDGLAEEVFEAQEIRGLARGVAVSRPFRYMASCGEEASP
ncbi:MAG: DUF1592 domain-containing protein [Myxococcota bacterium]